MKIFFRIVKYFLKYKGRLFVGLCGTFLISISDVLSVELITKMFGILNKVSILVNEGKTLLIDDSIKLFNKIPLYHFNLSLSGNKDAFNVIVWFAVLTILLILIKSVFVFIREYLLNSILQKILRDIRVDLFNSIVYFPVKVFDQQKTGAIMSRVTNDINLVEQSLLMIVEISQNLILTIVFATALFTTNWQLTFFTICIFAVLGIVTRKFGDRIRSASRYLSNSLADISAFLQERLSGIRIVKSFTREEHEREVFRDKAGQNYSFAMRIVRTISFLSPTTELFNAAATALLIVFTAFLFITGNMTIELVLGFLFYVTFLAKPVKALSDTLARVQRAIVSAGFIFDLIDSEKESIKGDPNVKITKGKVVFKKVSFSYNEENDALINTSFTVKPGERVAIVGPSGAGKTTLINLIPRFYELTNGAILLDDQDIQTFNLRQLRKDISIVPQEVMLFSGTIEDNIRYGRLDATEEEIIAASKAANAHNFIISQSNGYKTEVGERGLQLSGGQRQRIAIARAILRNPKILLLDEATSALDSESEQLVQEALERLMEGRTTLIIAHRLSTILHSDNILVFDKGRLIEQGTHAKLIKKRSGIYKRLYELQFKHNGAAV